MTSDLQAAFSAILFFYFYQDDVVPDLLDTVPGNHKFGIPSQKPAQLSGAGNDKGQYGAALAVDLQVTDASQGTAGTDIDDFFLLQITQTHERFCLPLCGGPRRHSVIVYAGSFWLVFGILLLCYCSRGIIETDVSKQLHISK